MTKAAVIEIDRYGEATDDDRLVIRPVWGSSLTIGNEKMWFYGADGPSARQKAVDIARGKGCTDLKIIDKDFMREAVAKIRLRNRALKH